jgi:hypothetical protein
VVQTASDAADDRGRVSFSTGDPNLVATVSSRKKDPTPWPNPEATSPRPLQLLKLRPRPTRARRERK